jgi:hypothetical protein
MFFAECSNRGELIFCVRLHGSRKKDAARETDCPKDLGDLSVASLSKEMLFHHSTQHRCYFEISKGHCSELTVANLETVSVVESRLPSNALRRCPLRNIAAIARSAPSTRVLQPQGHCIVKAHSALRFSLKRDSLSRTPRDQADPDQCGTSFTSPRAVSVTRSRVHVVRAEPL